MERSFYGVVARNPVFSLLAAVGLGAAFALGARGRRRSADAQDEAEDVGDESTYGIADVTPDRGPEEVIRGDTSIADALATGELRPAASPRVREQTMARPIVAPLADVRGSGDTSTEDVPSTSLLDPRLIDRSPSDTSQLADMPRVSIEPPNQRQGPSDSGRGKTDEEWPELG